MDKILGIVIDRHELAHTLRGLQVLPGYDLIHDTAHAGEYIDGRKMVLRGDGAREHDMAVENTAHGIGDRLIHIIAVDEHRVDPRDGALITRARPL